MGLVSVVIPYYKNVHTIERALQSVFNQSYKLFNVILVNDCSPDWNELETILEKFKEIKIEVIHHEYNKNGSAARNTGINAAKGEFIALLDADDEWANDHIENSLNQYSNLQSDNVLIYCKSIVKTGVFKDIIMPSSGINKGEKISDYLFVYDGFIPTPSMFAPSHVFKKNLFDERLIRHQDYKFLADIEKNGIIVSMSDHIGVIVHWEYNDISKKGGTWEYSLNWVKQNRTFFTNKSYRYFILKHVIFPLFQKKIRLKGLSIFLKHCIYLYPLKLNYKIISMFLFGRIVFSKI